jgi:hypothetical protein
MSLDFEELDYRPTPIGALSLRRRRELKLAVDVFEIKLGDEFLMSSLFTASEIALARLGLAELSEHGLDVVVGGLGLGYTAKAVLEHHKVASLLVVEALEAVIEWHAEGLVPLGPELTGDSGAASFKAISSRSRRPKRALIRPSRPADLTQCSWTSIIPPTFCSIRRTPLSTASRASPGLPHICAPAVSSLSGPMIVWTTSSPRVLAAFSRMRAPRR